MGKNKPPELVIYILPLLLAQALNDTAYTNNPKFLTVVNEYGFHAIPDFSKQSIADRAEIGRASCRERVYVLV